MPPRARQIVRTPAIVLQRTNFGDVDIVAALLTPAIGKVSALAKGARNSRRRFVGGLSPSMLGEAEIRITNGEMAYLEGFEILKGRMAYGAELSKSAHAAYAVEIADRLLAPGQVESATFDLLARFLDLLETEEVSPTRLRAYELGVLRELGFLPQFLNCSRCSNQFSLAEHVRFDASRGTVLCCSCATVGDLLSGRARLALASLQSSAMSDLEELPADLNSECRRVTLALIHQHLQSPLKSLAFMEKVGKNLSGSR